MKSQKKSSLISLFIFLSLIFFWAITSNQKGFTGQSFPSLETFLQAGFDEIKSGRLFKDLFASVYRWLCGFSLSVFIGVPFGLWLGRTEVLRNALGPFFNLLRSLSPLAWIPFAVIWFGIGDLPVIFLIFLGCFFPLLFSTLASVSSVPKVYDQMASDFHYQGTEYFFHILFPAVLPQIVSSLRLVSAMGWIVLVPAEMLAGSEGLGFAILDARNGMRTDLLVLNMAIVAITSHGIDLILQTLNHKSKVRWAHEQ